MTLLGTSNTSVDGLEEDDEAEVMEGEVAWCTMVDGFGEPLLLEIFASIISPPSPPLPSPVLTAVAPLEAFMSLVKIFSSITSLFASL